MKTNCLSWSLISLLATGVAMAETADIDPLQLMERVKWRADGEDRRAAITMVLTEADGYSRERNVVFYEKDYGRERKTAIFIQDPPDLRGTSLLIGSYDEADEREDDIYLYLPAMQKTKRIAAGNKRGRFVGSEFSFADMERIHLRDYTYQYRGEEIIDGRNCHVIEAAASGDRTEEKTGYKKRKLWVDQERDLILRDEYFDTRGLKLKTFHAQTVKQIDGFWTITDGRMENLQSGRVTQLKMLEITYNGGVEDKLFNAQSLSRGAR